MGNRKAAIIIVNWNGKHLLKECLDSVFAQTYQNYDVYLVDNGSTDGSVDFAKENYPKVKLIQLKENTGFAKGNNIGIAKALEDKQVEYIVCINNDTKTKKDFLEKLVACAQANPHVGSVAPKMKYFHEENLVDSVGILIHRDGGGLSRGNKEPDEGQYDQSEEIFGACGGAVLYKRKMLEDIKHGKDEFFDNVFFAYYEDLDLAWRARLAGWKSISCPWAVIYHVHSATGVSYSPFKAFHVNRNRFFVVLKNYSFWQCLWTLLVLTPIRYFHLLNSMRVKKGPTHELCQKTSALEPLKIVLKGWASVLFNLPGMLKKRRQIQKNRKVQNDEIKKWFEKYSTTMEKMIYR